MQDSGLARRGFSIEYPASRIQHLASRVAHSATLRVRNRIYARVFDRQWVRQHMPDAEVRRQQAAYGRGVRRTAVVAAVLLAALGGLAGTAIYQKGLADERWARSCVADGTRLMDSGDLLGALPWFAEALRVEGGDRAREEADRMRIAATLAECPRLLHAWFHGAERSSAGATRGICAAEFSPDGRRVL